MTTQSDSINTLAQAVRGARVVLEAPLGERKPRQSWEEWMAGLALPGWEEYKAARDALWHAAVGEGIHRAALAMWVRSRGGVGRLAKKAPELDLEDAEQDAALVLRACCATYDPDGGASLVTYVYRSLARELDRAVKVAGSPLSYSRHAAQEHDGVRTKVSLTELEVGEAVDA